MSLTPNYKIESKDIKLQSIEQYSEIIHDQLDTNYYYFNSPQSQSKDTIVYPPLLKSYAINKDGGEGSITGHREYTVSDESQSITYTAVPKSGWDISSFKIDWSVTQGSAYFSSTISNPTVLEIPEKTYGEIGIKCRWTALPASLTIGGSWSNTQFTGQSVDPTGLTFTVTYGDGSTASKIASQLSISPSTWGSTVGTQIATFSYTENGKTVSATRGASVQQGGDPILDNNSWSLIHQLAAAGVAAQFWSVGDYKNISIAAGTIYRLQISAGTYRAVIIGINHNPTYENPNSIDFAIGQNTSGTDICFHSGGKNGIDGVPINPSQHITTGGWTGSQMYLTYLPQFYNLLSGNTGLQSAMIAPKKYTHNYEGGSANATAANVTLSENSNYKMFLMAEFEIHGTRKYANPYEQNKQSQYAYYSSSGLAKSKIRYRADNGSVKPWWSRSAQCNSVSKDDWCTVNTSGNHGLTMTAYTEGLVPCFRV